MGVRVSAARINEKSWMNGFRHGVRLPEEVISFGDTIEGAGAVFKS
jgi:hypothetical protein